MTATARNDRPVICLGGVVWESIFQVDHIPGRGTKLLPRAGRQLASGMAPAAAVTIARLGGAAALWARVGDDAAGQSVRTDLAREGVDVSGVAAVPGAATAFSSILVDPRGERLVVPCFDAALLAGAEGLPLQAVRGAAAVLADMRWPDGADALLRQARRDGVPSVLDADVAPPEQLGRLMPLADHVLLSEDALRVLRPGLAPAEALVRLALELPAAQVVGVTLGPEGALLIERGSGDHAPRHVPGLRVTAVDTLNAGDVWHGAYAWGLVRGMALVERVTVAHAAAAIKCGRPWGRLGAPTWEEVRARLASPDSFNNLTGAP